MSRLTSPKYVLRVVKPTEYSEVSAKNRARGFWLTYAEYRAGGGGISTRRVGGVKTVAYSARATALRRCLGTTKAGNPCRAWAVWDDPRQLCVRHAGRGHTGPMEGKRGSYPRGRYVPCRCEAYAWPHRPSAGLCCWPEPPVFRLTTPVGTKNPDNWIWPVGEVVRVEHGEPKQPEGPRARPVIVGEHWTREEEIADIKRRIGR